MEENDKFSLKKYQIFWDNIEKALNEGTMSGYKVAIIETEKILSLVLNEKKIPGKNIQEKIKNAGTVIKNQEKLNYARSMHDKIIKELGFDVSSEDTKEIISGYYQAISDIVKMDFKNFSTKEKINLMLQKHFSRFPEQIKKLSLLAFALFFLVFVSAETPTGRSISEAMVSFSKFLFYKVLPAILLIIAVGTVIIGALYYWQKRK